MKPFSLIVAAACAASLPCLAPSLALAQSALCSGQVDLQDMEIGCDNEATKTVSLAKCDFRSGKVPDVALYNVIDGRIGNQSVTVEQTQAGSFTVRIRPLQGIFNGETYCKVSRFDWEAQ